MLNAVIIGASGYTGVELIRLLNNHKHVTIKALAADKNAGKPASDIYNHLKLCDLPHLTKLEDISFTNIDVCFCCLPHATSQEIIKDLPKNIKVIDLSADFRLYNTNTYEQWYGSPHRAPELQKQAVYGLSELYREKVKNARIVACPGCYPTSAILPLAPLVKESLIEHHNIIIDSKSGATGAGRSAKQNLLFCEMNDNISAYNICNHRHIPEIEQTLNDQGTSIRATVNFTPQILPMNRGIISTIYVTRPNGITQEDLVKCLKDTYKGEPFVHLLEQSQAETRSVHGTNNCLISISQGRSPNMTVIVSVIDNLMKGAAGQAVQNMNIMFDLNEVEGLDYTPIFP